MPAGLAIAVLLFAWGAHAVVPWRLRRGGEGRRRWAYVALPLLVLGAAAALLYVRTRPDAALAAGLLPVTANLPGRLIALLFPAVLVADVVVLLGREKLEDAGWALAAGLGLLLAAAASLAGELLRVGEGPGGALPVLLALAACWLPLALAAGEVLAPGRPLLALLAALALPVHFRLLPPGLRASMLVDGTWLTLGAAVLLLAVARWVPPRLRRPALAAGVLLASLALGKAASLSESLTQGPPPAMPSLPVP